MLLRCGLVKFINKRKMFVLLLPLIVFMGNAKDNEFTFSGSLKCVQKSKISESLLGLNQYTVTYSPSKFVAEQQGVVSVKDLDTKMDSSIEYVIRFKFQLKGNEFSNVAESIDFKIVSDDLNVFSDNPSSAFPAVGESVEGKFEVLSEKIVRKTFQDGTTIDCIKL